MFDEEASSDRLNPADILGHLLLVWSVDYIPHSPTQYSTPDKPSDVVVVDVVDLDLPDENGHQGYVSRRAWWRQSRLIRDLKTRIGRPNPYLLRLGKDTSKPGANAPYVIIPALGDQDARARGEAWIAAHPDFRPSERLDQTAPAKPATVPQAPAAASYQQPVAVPYAASAPAAAPVSAAPPLPPPPPRLTGPQETALERMARQAAQVRDQYGGPVTQPDDPPF